MFRNELARGATDLETEMKSLQRHLDELAAGDDGGLMKRYPVRRRRPPQGMYWKLRWLAAQTLRILEDTGIKPSNPWPPRLKHAEGQARAQPLVIWAVGAERDTLRRACRGFREWQASLPDFAPVLITDVADFAFFSRLHWLVEYVPKLAGEGEPYDMRKARFLARLYRGAPALPVSFGLLAAAEREPIERELKRWPPA